MVGKRGFFRASALWKVDADAGEAYCLIGRGVRWFQVGRGSGRGCRHWWERALLVRDRKGCPEPGSEKFRETKTCSRWGKLI